MNHERDFRYLLSSKKKEKTENAHLDSEAINLFREGPRDLFEFSRLIPIVAPSMSGSPPSLDEHLEPVEATRKY